MKTIKFPIPSYYGWVTITQYGKEDFRLEIPDWHGISIEQVSREFFEACKKEFGNHEVNKNAN